MSDYLWDKNGEPGEDVERLEGLLGQLRFQPRTFEVPATIPAVARRPPRAISNSRRALIAVAASLVLTLLAGAWLVFTRQRATSTPRNASASAPNEKTLLTQPQQPEQELASGSDTTRAGKGTHKMLRDRDGQLKVRDAAKRDSIRPDTRSHTDPREAIFGNVFTAKQVSRLPPAGRNVASLLNLQPGVTPPVSVTGGGKRPRYSNVPGADAAREQVVKNSADTLTPQEREALEKFALAMRVTSEKLNYAERQMQSMSESLPQR